MAKMDWTGLKVIEEWGQADPSDARKKMENQFSLKIISSIIVKAYLREKLKSKSQTEKMTSPNDIEGEAA
jgi:hypothetical protein